MILIHLIFSTKKREPFLTPEIDAELYPYMVCFGNNPAVVHSDIIDIIRTRIDQNGFVKISNDLKPEDKVAMNAGPLRNLIGILEREVTGTERSVILLSAIAYQGPSCD